MELLGFPGITQAEDALIRGRLRFLQCLEIDGAVQDKAIELRRTRKIKLPDALIAATALCHGLQLLTMDGALQAVVREVMAAGGTFFRRRRFPSLHSRSDYPKRAGISPDFRAK